MDLGGLFEIVVFTAAIQDYADFILDIVDSKRVVKARLYR
jgi:CTD small phosphatase-like protein 2